MIVPTATPATWDQHRHRCAQVPWACWRTLGWHPWFVEGTPDLDEMRLQLEVAWAKDVVGLGEMGLDKAARSWPLQIPWFQAQLRLAEEVEAPVVLHVVRAHQEVLGALRKTSLVGMIHGFSGSAELARAYSSAGIMISVGAAVLDPSRRLRQAVGSIPRDNLLVETDEHPLPLGDIIAAVATLRGETAEAVAGYTEANALRLFGVSCV